MPGHGQPIDNIGVVHDELWWLKAKLRDEDIEDVNARIRYINSHGASGSPSTAAVIDVEELLGRWRAAHPAVPDIED